MTPLIKKLSEPKTLLSIGIVYTILITVALLSPVAEIRDVGITFLDKLIHVLLHLILSYIWLTYVFSGDNYHISFRTLFVVLGICFCYGVVIEASQHWFTLSRKFDLYDIIANGIGSLIGLLSFWIVRSKIVH